MSWGKTKDFGAYMLPKRAGAEVDMTAAGSGDNTEVDGAWIDTRDYESLEFILSFTATLETDETLKLVALNVQDATDINGSDAADVSSDYLGTIAAATAKTLATGNSGGSVETGEYAVGIDLTMCKRYVRVQWTPDLSRGGTDTAKVIPLYVLGGAKYPQSRTTRTTIRA